MTRKRNKRLLVSGWALLFVLGCSVSLFSGISPVSGLGGTDYSWAASYDGGDESEYGWSFASSTNLMPGLELTFDNCATCHVSMDNITRHHDLITTAGKKCIDCHQMKASGSGSYNVEVVRECQTCHSLVVHNDFQHRIGSCGSCHGSNLIDMHSRRSGNNSSAAACYLCQPNATAKVRQTIAKGTDGQTVFCTDCHGANPHSWKNGLSGL